MVDFPVSRRWRRTGERYRARTVWRESPFIYERLLLTFKKIWKISWPAPWLRKLKAPSVLLVADETNYNSSYQEDVTVRSNVITDEEKSQIKVRKRCPCEEELDCVVNELNLQVSCQLRKIAISLYATDLKDEHTDGILPWCPDPIEEDRRMEWSEKGAIQPSATLRDKFGNLERCKQHFSIGYSLLTVVGTSVEALALLTYLRLLNAMRVTHNIGCNVTYIQPSRFLVTISKQRIRSSAKYMLRSGIYVNRTRNQREYIIPNSPAPPAPPPCMASPLKYEARGPLPLGPFRRALYL